MRLDKFISNSTDHSRKAVRQLLRDGRVHVDGIPAGDPGQHIHPGQRVTLDAMPIVAPGARYFMLHKPAGYVCATKDSQHPTVLDLLDEPNKERLQIAGRLDIDTTGLVLITDDGPWNHAVTSPRRECRKIYRVKTADPIPEDAAKRFARGMLLDGERQRTRPARLDLLGSHGALLAIHEGKYHQVKRMFGALGNRVVALHREAIGDVALDPALVEGHYRPLTPGEVASLAGR